MSASRGHHEVEADRSRLKRAAFRVDGINKPVGITLDELSLCDNAGQSVGADVEMGCGRCVGEAGDALRQNFHDALCSSLSQSGWSLLPPAGGSRLSAGALLHWRAEPLQRGGGWGCRRRGATTGAPALMHPLPPPERLASHGPCCRHDRCWWPKRRKRPPVHHSSFLILPQSPVHPSRVGHGSSWPLHILRARFAARFLIAPDRSEDDAYSSARVREQFPVGVAG